MGKYESIIPALRRKTLVYELEDKHKEELLNNELLYITNYVLHECKYIVYYGTIEYIEEINGKNVKNNYNLDGMTYIGQINSKKQRHGMGITYYSSKFSKNNNCDNKHYIGEYKNDNKHGLGELEYHDHSLFIGEWKKNKKEGLGVLYIKDKYTYDGSFKNNELNGYGILDIYGNSKYEGDWYNSKLHGFCKKTKLTGEIEYSHWNHGKQNNDSIIHTNYNTEIINPIYIDIKPL